MPGLLTDLTEVTTALGMLSPRLEIAFTSRPPELVGVGAETWRQLREKYEQAEYSESFQAAFENGQAFLSAGDGLRDRRPRRVEWKGPHRPPGDDVIPADLRVDRVYLVSCKYLSKVLLNPGPPRLFDRLLVGDEKSGTNWFHEIAPIEFEALYHAARAELSLLDLPSSVRLLTRADQLTLKSALGARTWPPALVNEWAGLCRAVSAGSERRWRAAMPAQRDQLRLLWRLLRITTATYFVLGTDRANRIRVRVDSAWDWMQMFELRRFEVSAGTGRQPEVAWRATVRRRSEGTEILVDGHVEIRWSHGRFLGAPEAKVYLDSPLRGVPGYHPLA